jgi:hypothetical protein
MNNASNQRERRLQILAADLAELQRRAEQQRIEAAIEDAQRRVAKLRPGRADVLKPYQVESAVRRIGKGEAVLPITRSLHCASAALYRALAAL